MRKNYKEPVLTVFVVSWQRTCLSNIITKKGKGDKMKNNFLTFALIMLFGSGVLAETTQRIKKIERYEPRGFYMEHKRVDMVDVTTLSGEELQQHVDQLIIAERNRGGLSVALENMLSICADMKNASDIVELDEYSSAICDAVSNAASSLTPVGP